MSVLSWIHLCLGLGESDSEILILLVFLMTLTECLQKLVLKNEFNFRFLWLDLYPKILAVWEAYFCLIQCFEKTAWNLWQTKGGVFCSDSVLKMKLKEKEDICYLFKWKIVKWKCNFFLYGFSLKIVISLDMLKKKVKYSYKSILVTKTAFLFKYFYK